MRKLEVAAARLLRATQHDSDDPASDAENPATVAPCTPKASCGGVLDKSPAILRRRSNDVCCDEQWADPSPVVASDAQNRAEESSIRENIQTLWPETFSNAIDEDLET